jgi:hypothetical protein
MDAPAVPEIAKSPRFMTFDKASQVVRRHESDSNHLGVRAQGLVRNDGLEGVEESKGQDDPICFRDDGDCFAQDGHWIDLHNAVSGQPATQIPPFDDDAVHAALCARCYLLLKLLDVGGVSPPLSFRLGPRLPTSLIDDVSCFLGFPPLLLQLTSLLVLLGFARLCRRYLSLAFGLKSRRARTIFGSSPTVCRVQRSSYLAAGRKIFAVSRTVLGPPLSVVPEPNERAAAVICSWARLSTSPKKPSSPRRRSG